LKCAEAGSPSLLFSQLLEKAIGLDPTNSMALAALAFARHFEAVFGRGGGPAESHARLGEAARKAVAADDSGAMAHTSLAIFDLFSGRHEEARRAPAPRPRPRSQLDVCARLSRRQLP
jgi:hypothetical protein